MNSYYKEPRAVFSSFKSYKYSTNESFLTVEDTKRNILQISFYKNVGWELEVRHDLSNPDIPRQPFTGAQNSLVKEELLLTEKIDRLEIIVNEYTLSLFKKNFSFVITLNNSLVFESSGVPFSSHKIQTEIFEKLMSIKVTDYSKRGFMAPQGTLFKTHMNRFQYPRPDGVVFGLPGQTGEMNRNGYRFELYNSDEFLHIPGRPLYQSWPILFHKSKDMKNWTSIFHDNPSRTFVDIGDFYDEQVTFESRTGNSRVYIFTGKNLSEVSAKVVSLLGTTSLLPLWAFGYQQSRWSYMNTEEIRNMVSKMKKHQIPLDAVYFDIDYMDSNKVFTVNRKTFNDLPQLISDLKKANINSVYLVDPGIKSDESYSAYKSLKKSGAYLKKKDGKPLLITVWPGITVLPDFRNEKAFSWWTKLQNDWLRKYNFDGIWNDMNEPSNFEGGNKVVSEGYTERGSIEPEYNLYGYFMAKASRNAWESVHPEKRAFNISRSGYPGIQQYSVVWHGDNWSWWEHLQLALNTTILYSLSGMFYSGADIPGFLGHAPEDLAIRFFQLGAFLPFFRGHSAYFSKDKEPYVYTEKTKNIIKNVIYLRYSLLREWYSGFEKATRENNSPFLPVFTQKGELIPNQFTLFNKFLVAPIIERDQIKKIVYLPEGEWYELGDTKKKIKGNQWITIDITLESLPVFVKAGSIVVRNSKALTTNDTIHKKETYEVYEDSVGNAEGYWYNDDGISVAVNQVQRLNIFYRNKKISKEEVIIS